MFYPKRTLRLTFGFMLLGVMLLGASVFAWGLSYKLSLYKDVPNLPAAKLLSNRERAGYALPAFASDAASLGANPRAWQWSTAVVILALAWAISRVLDPRTLFRQLLARFRGRPKTAIQRIGFHLFLRPPPRSI